MHTRTRFVLSALAVAATAPIACGHEPTEASTGETSRLGGDAPTTTSADVLTQRNDAARTSSTAQPGLNATSFAAASRWGVLGSLPVDGAIFAQPLFVSALATADGAAHDAVLVATARNKVYAFDAKTFRPLWGAPRVLSPPDDSDSDPASFGLKNLPGCAFISPLSVDDGVQPQWGIGIQSTPVIDRARGAMYVSYRTKQNGAVSQHVAALSLVDGSVIADRAIDLGQDILGLRQRASLLLSKGVIYVAFASHCEDPPVSGNPAFKYRGRVLALDQATLAVRGQFQTVSAAKVGGGVWQASTGLAADANGDVYFTTGNSMTWPGVADPYTNDATSYASSAIRLHPVIARDASGVQSVSFVDRAGEPGRPWDTFTPYRAYWQNWGDFDLGSAGVVLIPGTNDMVFAGKEAIAYVLDRDHLGGASPYAWTNADLAAHCRSSFTACDGTTHKCPYSPNDPTKDPSALQELQVGTNIDAPGKRGCPAPAMDDDAWWEWPHVHGTPAYADFTNHRSFLYFWPEKDRLHAYERDLSQPGVARFHPTPSDSAMWAPAGPPGGMPGGMVSVAYDPTSTSSATAGVVFASVPSESNDPVMVHGRLVAFDPIPASDGHLTKLWDDATSPAYRLAKFVPPTIAGGRVFLATSSNEVIVYGPGSDRQLAASAGIAPATQGNAQLDALTVGNDGVLRVDAVQGTAAWAGPYPIGFAPPAAAIATGAQNAQLDAFVVGNDGSVQVYWVGAATPWSAPRAIAGPGSAPPGGHLATAPQGGTQLDLFYVDANGRLMVSWAPLDGSRAWAPPAPISAAGFAPPGAPVATAVQGGTQLDVLVVDVNGAVQTFAASGLGAWTGPYRITNDGFTVRGAALAPTAQGANQLDVLVVDAGGALDVLNVTGFGAWGSERITGAGFARAGSPVATGTQGSQLDALVVDARGTLDVFAVSGAAPWSGPYAVSRAGALPPGANVVASPQGAQLDAFVAAGGALSVYAVTSGPWAGPFVLP